MNIKSDFSHDKYRFINFVSLSDEILLTILEWRNHPDVRKCMNNITPISVESHLNFCHNLRNREDVSYWLIMKDSEPLGVLNIIDINYHQKTCEPGFYIAPEKMGKGESIFLLAAYKSFILNQLGFNGLIGHNYIDNLPALMFTMFFGATIIDIVDIDGRKCVKSILEKEVFNKQGTDKLISRYAKFLRDWDTEKILSSKYESK